MSDILRIALVGSGSMGLNHARTIATGPPPRWRWSSTRRGARPGAPADQYDARWAPAISSALADVDAAVIAAPTEDHLRARAAT